VRSARRSAVQRLIPPACDLVRAHVLLRDHPERLGATWQYLAVRDPQCDLRSDARLRPFELAADPVDGILKPKAGLDAQEDASGSSGNPSATALACPFASTPWMRSE
jgi:hypothetical protein